MGSTWQPTHIDADLGNKTVGHARPNARNSVQALERFGKAAHPLRDFRADVPDAFVQRIDVAKLVGEQESLMRFHPPAERPLQ
jgi:hypothetical protein